MQINGHSATKMVAPIAQSSSSAGVPQSAQRWQSGVSSWEAPAPHATIPAQWKQLGCPAGRCQCQAQFWPAAAAWAGVSDQHGLAPTLHDPLTMAAARVEVKAGRAGHPHCAITGIAWKLHRYAWKLVIKIK